MKEKLPDGWEWKKLGDITEIRKGNSITKSIIEEGNIPVIAGGREPAYYHNKSNRDGETITVSASGAYAGYVNYFCTPIFASDCSTIKIFNSDALLTKFIYWRLKAYQEQIYALQKGGGQPHVYPKDLMEIPIPLPPLDVQQKIVSILEKAEDTKRLRAQADELTQQLLQSMFLKMFGNPLTNPMGWDVVQIRDIAIEHKQGLYTNAEYSKKGINLLRISDINDNGKINYDTMPFLDLDSKVINQFKLSKGDFVFARSGVSIGRCGIFEGDMPCVFGSFIIRFKFNPELIDNEFMLHYMKLPQNQRNIKSYSHGSANPNINAKNIKTLTVTLPPLSLQHDFVKFINSIEKIICSQVYCKNNLEFLFDSLMQKAFTGELVS